MDCQKIIEIYNETCYRKFALNDWFQSADLYINMTNVQIQNDKNCLKTMKMIEMYCKSEFKNKN